MKRKLIGKLSWWAKARSSAAFCSHGTLLMNVVAMKKEFTAEGNLHPTDEEIQVTFLEGNLCRCTGYMGQMRAIRQYVDEEVEA